MLHHYLLLSTGWILIGFGSLMGLLALPSPRFLSSILDGSFMNGKTIECGYGELNYWHKRFTATIISCSFLILVGFILVILTKF